MTTLTKEYFDTKLTKLETNLRKHTEEQIEELAGMVERRFDEVERRLDVRERVEKLEQQMAKVGTALDVQL